MSSLITKKYTVCLYVQGLGQKPWFFDDTINLVTNGCPQKHLKFSQTIDMSDFDYETSQFTSSTSETVFNNRTSDLVAASQAHPNMTVHVKLCLNKDPNNKNYETIPHQKTRLVFLIDRIKSLSNSVRIVLVGHSQGGLVNLEAATERPYQIERLISLSTPYAPSFLASLYGAVIAFEDYLNAMMAVLYPGVSTQILPYFSSCVSTLAEASYYNNLKARWDSLPYRPHLLAICGISCKLKTPGPSMPYFNNMTPIWQPTDDYRAFDGLVSAQEQNAISHAQIVNLYDSSLPCASTLRFLNVPCANSHSANCIGPCPLPIVSYTDVLASFATHMGTYWDEAWAAANDAMKNLPFSSAEYVRPIYDAFIGAFSHGRICTSPEAIQLIRGKLES